MLEYPAPLLLLFTAIAEFGIIVFVGAMALVRYLQGRRSSSIPTGQYDLVLWPQLQTAGIKDWKTLQQLSGLTVDQVNQLRMGHLSQLSLGQLQQVAALLEWTLDDLLDVYGLSAARQENRALRQEGLRLQAALQDQQQTLMTAWRRDTFAQLQPLLTNYPTVQAMIQMKPDLLAKNVISLFTNLDNLLQQWECQPIGTAWAQVAYDPQLHQPDQPDIAPGEPVYVRFVGYTLGNMILCPAKVSRTLPVSAQP
ncbi:MAG: helix-turn-helix transcriptional regulator [Cyanobacteria bacterium]|nr:helix-turn-helix transcriptional regulator [Cyanobacteriota bacterium]MDW8201272.1 helix-turn-helix domain-containing protein [Cyanobacteriota bacterium SKYGB_h_bin112]